MTDSIRDAHLTHKQGTAISARIPWSRQFVRRDDIDQLKDEPTIESTKRLRTRLKGSVPAITQSDSGPLSLTKIRPIL